jgi:hypothetical protein
MLYPTRTLLALLLLSRTAHSTTPVILFTHQSQNIQFQYWFQFFTLCFAPLIAHVVAGVASPTVIPPHSKEPTWSALLPHFNPISIVWRWYAIADRRLRARNWDATDMAACNAVFWNSDTAHWDNSEETMVRAREWITRYPGPSYVPLVSMSSLTTVVLTLQGIQASFLIFAHLKPNSPYGFGQGLPNVFIPLGCLGLMRLPAALWLSDKHASLDLPEVGSSQNVAQTPTEVLDGSGDPLVQLDPRTSKRAIATTTVNHISDTNSHLSEPTVSTNSRLHPINSPVARLYRIWWVVSITALVGGSAVSTTHLLWRISPSFPYLSLSHLIFSVLYLIITTTTVLITDTYILLGRTESTLIPCIHDTWYKVFTVLLMALAVVTTVVAALETRQLHDGSLSTLPEFQCNKTAALCVPVPRGHGNFNT